jgi:polyhydroxyalkanoate synthase
VGSRNRALRGLRPDDADRTRFMARQMLDLVSPSNFPALNPEIIEETGKRHGMNLAEGARNFLHDYVTTVAQIHEPAPKALRSARIWPAHRARSCSATICSS